MRNTRATGKRLTRKQAAINLARQTKRAVTPQRWACVVGNVTNRETTGTVQCSGPISPSAITVQVRTNVDLASGDYIWVREDQGAQGTFIFDGFVKGGGTGNNAADAPIPWTQSPGVTSPAGTDLSITAPSGQTTNVGSSGDPVTIVGDIGGIDLNDLDDVNAGSPSDNDALFWDNGTSKWVNMPSWALSEKELTVGANAKYATVALAVAAASSGDTIRVGAGVHTVAAVDIPSGVDLRGSGKDVTILRSTANLEAINFQGSNRCSDLTIENNYDNAGDVTGVKLEGADVELRDVRVSCNNPSGGGYAINPRSTTAKLIDCEAYATGAGGSTCIALYTFSGSADVEVYGGYFDGDDADIDAGVAGDVIAIFGPTLENGLIDTAVGGGTTKGSWQETDGDLVMIQANEIKVQGPASSAHSGTQRDMVAKLGHILDGGHPCNPYPTTRDSDDAEFNNSTQALNNTLGTHAGSDYWEILAGGGYSPPYLADIDTSVPNCLYVWKTNAAGANVTVYKGNMTKPDQDEGYHTEVFVLPTYTWGDGGYFAMKLYDSTSTWYTRLEIKYASATQQIEITPEWDIGAGAVFGTTMVMETPFTGAWALCIRRQVSDPNVYARFMFAIEGAPSPAHFAGADQFLNQLLGAWGSWRPDELHLEFYAGVGGKGTWAVDSVRRVT